jgi:hypothetical protein
MSSASQASEKGIEEREGNVTNSVYRSAMRSEVIPKRENRK